MIHFLRRLRFTAVGILTLSAACNFQNVSDPNGEDGGTQNVSDTDGENGGTLNLAVFQDPDSEFSSSDVHDVEDEIVQFDTNAKTIIWAATGEAFQEGVWEIDGNLLGPTAFFQVRFGNVDGERRAFFTERELATICDIEVVGGALSISATSTLVPQ